jgi:hypothetical protein
MDLDNVPHPMVGKTAGTGATSDLYPLLRLASRPVRESLLPGGLLRALDANNAATVRANRLPSVARYAKMAASRSDF